MLKMALLLSIRRTVAIPTRFFANKANKSVFLCNYSSRAVNKKSVSLNHAKSQLNRDRYRSLRYDALQQLRQKQARCSVLVHHSTPTCMALEIARRHGRITSAYTFCRDTEKSGVKHYTLVEYENINGVNKILSNAKQFPNDLHIPIETRMIYCRYPSERRFKSNATIGDSERVVVDKYGLCNLTAADLVNCDSLNDQISLFYRRQTLSELDIRLRYFLSSEIESAVHKLYPYASASLFGSSVNGFGQYNCDLDIVLNLWSAKHYKAKDEVDESQHGGIYFMSKMRSDNERLMIQSSLDTIAGLLQNIVPQMMGVKRILRARIPIVKFLHSSSGIDCDLCIDNRSAVDMSELVYFLSTWERDGHRVLALVFVIRRWARSNGVTQATPGNWMSNFMLLLLTVHFLQSRPKPILPLLRSLKLAPGPFKILSPDISLPIDSVQITDTRDNAEQLGDLLLNFFSYFHEFDFDSFGISIVEGCKVQKPDATTALFIENPLERELNVAKNVQSAYVDEFKSACRTAHGRLLETRSSDDWGLLSILKLTDPESVPGETAENNAFDASSSVSHEHDSNGPKPSRLNVRVDDLMNDSEATQLDVRIK